MLCYHIRSICYLEEMNSTFKRQQQCVAILLDTFLKDFAKYNFQSRKLRLTSRDILAHPSLTVTTMLFPITTAVQPHLLHLIDGNTS